MSKSVEVKLDLPGINEMMKSPEIQAAVQAAGDAVAQAASALSGEEYEAESHLADYVAISNVFPASRRAAKDNIDNNTLLLAVGTAGIPTQKPKL